MRAAVALVALLMVAPRLAYADDEVDTVCEYTIDDPVMTPVRDVYLDAQRSACMRQELSTALAMHVLLATSEFYGAVGADLALRGRKVLATTHELSAELRLIDFGFVQNTVNKVTNMAVGPLILGYATGAPIGREARGALILRFEVPYTRDQMSTIRSSGEIAGLVSARLAQDFVLHTRLGAVGMVAQSELGTMRRLGLLAGADVAWHVRPRLALQVGLDAMAGWDHGFDYVMARAGVQRRLAEVWRWHAGVGVPFGGAERTNVVIDLGLARDL